MERKFAILAYNCDNYETLNNLVDSLIAYVGADNIKVFFNTNPDGNDSSTFECKCQSVVYVPKEFDNVPKVRNYINQQYRVVGFNGFLHVIEWNTKLLANPTNFMQKLEQMMDVLDYNVWFNTICDPCNYVYSKYCPRTYINVDDDKYKNIGTSKLVVTSHSNTQWIVYNMAKATDSNLHFDEDFTIPMYYIIEFLSRRKAEAIDNQPYFMNQYFTVVEEKGLFQRVGAEIQPAQEQLKKENEIFQQKKINHSQDGNLDTVLTTLYLKLKSKLG